MAAPVRSEERLSQPAVEIEGDAAAPASGASVLMPIASLSCQKTPDSAEPLDPPVTSALPGGAAFVARGHFREDISATSPVRIAWLGSSFVRRFVPKVEAPSGGTPLRVYGLTRLSRNVGIVEELRAHLEVRLAEVWCLLRKQPAGEDGALLTDATPNVFYVRDAAGVLGAVDAVWSGAGWEIGASAVTGDRPWLAGTRVIAH